MHCALTQTLFNPTPFMITHLQSVSVRGSGPICIGGLITSIARALNLNNKLATSAPLDTPFLDLDACCSMRLIKNRQDGRYHLMVGNHTINSIILPNSACTNVRDRNNWFYNLNALELSHNINIQGNEGNSIDDDIEHDAPEPPTHLHTTHDTINIFESTSSRHQSHDGNDYTSIMTALDDVLDKLRHLNTLDA